MVLGYFMDKYSIYDCTAKNRILVFRRL